MAEDNAIGLLCHFHNRNPAHFAVEDQVELENIVLALEFKV